MKVLVNESFRYASGQVASQQLIDVFDRGLGTRPLIYSPLDDTVLTANPARTDSLGNLSFYVEEGEYDFSAFGSRIPFDVLAPEGGPDASFWHHAQAAPAATWTIIHNLGRKPPVSIILDLYPGRAVETDVDYADDSTVVLTFPNPVSGHAYM